MCWGNENMPTKETEKKWSVRWTKHHVIMEDLTLNEESVLMEKKNNEPCKTMLRDQERQRLQIG